MITEIWKIRQTNTTTMARAIMIGSLVLLGCLSTLHSPATAAEPKVVSVKKIWDLGKHNAFTDLIRFEDKWWCTLRESETHASPGSRDS